VALILDQLGIMSASRNIPPALVFLERAAKEENYERGASALDSWSCLLSLIYRCHMPPSQIVRYFKNLGELNIFKFDHNIIK